MTAEVEVDFNETNALGQVKARLSKADGVVRRGDYVLAVDRFESMQRWALVARMDPSLDRMLLEICEDRCNCPYCPDCKVDE